MMLVLGPTSKKKRNFVSSWRTHMLWVSRLIVNEKQHWISGSVDLKSGLFKEQLVNIAFCELSKAIEPKFSQYVTK